MLNDSVKHEKRLLQQIAEGDETAFNLLFKNYRNRLFTYLYKITKSKETSEEIVLDVFLKIWMGRDIVTEIENFEAFLFRIARNKALDFLRSLQKAPNIQHEVWEILELSSNEATDDNIIQKDTANYIETAVRQLSPQRQKVFLLSREEGLSHEEIAKRLQLSRNTVRNHISASLEFIRYFINTKTLIAGFILWY